MSEIAESVIATESVHALEDQLHGLGGSSVLVLEKRRKNEIYLVLLYQGRCKPYRDPYRWRDQGGPTRLETKPVRQWHLRQKLILLKS